METVVVTHNSVIVVWKNKLTIPIMWKSVQFIKNNNICIKRICDHSVTDGWTLIRYNFISLRLKWDHRNKNESNCDYPTLYLLIKRILENPSIIQKIIVIDSCCCSNKLSCIDG